MKQRSQNLTRRTFLERSAAHTSSALAHLGNIAYRVGRVLTFDPATEQFVGDKDANAMLSRHYRKPFAVPEKV